MQEKLTTLIVGLVLVTGGLTVEAGASSCPEARGTCQPIGKRSAAARPRAKAVPKLVVPKAEPFGQSWRAGKHSLF